MNGHSSAETLAFWIMDAARHCEGLVGDAEDAPIFIFSAGPCSGEDELRQRLAPTVATDFLVDHGVISAFAQQLVRVATAGRDGTAANEGETDASRAIRTACAASIANGQARFLRSMALAGEGIAGRARWGLVSTALTGDYALYFKLIFPRAKFIFLHRSPLDAFSGLLQRTSVESRPTESADQAASFAETWCTLVASFELWHKEVGGVMVGYDNVIAESPRELETYLAEPLGRAETLRASLSESATASELRADEGKAIAARTAEIAARCGYRLAMRDGAAGQLEMSRPIEEAVHVGERRVNCAVLVPAMRYIEPECDDALRELESRGYAVKRMYGASPVDHARSRLATTALEQEFDETLWIDADTGFDPDAVERLRSHNLPIVAGLYSRRGARGGLAMAPMPGTRELVMGEEGGLVEVLYAGAGFLLVSCEVYQAIRARFRLPLCDESTSRPTIPFFMPMLEDWGGKLTYLGEDYAFSRRARLCGYKIMADTSIRLWHIGTYRYGYEDAGNAVERVPTYRHVFESERRGQQ